MAKTSPTHTQECLYCYRDFVPAKRGTQKFCGSSCRTTYSKKKKRGTLGRFTHLPGPSGAPAPVAPGSPASFGQQVLAAGTGALAANAISQTTEYFAVTQGLIREVEKLTGLVQTLLAHHTTSTGITVAGLRHLLVKSGVPPSDVVRVLKPAAAALVAPVKAERTAMPEPVRRATGS